MSDHLGPEDVLAQGAVVRHEVKVLPRSAMGLYSRERDGGHARKVVGDELHILCDQVLSGPSRDGIERHPDSRFGEGTNAVYALLEGALEPGERVVELGNVRQ